MATHVLISGRWWVLLSLLCVISDGVATFAQTTSENHTPIATLQSINVEVVSTSEAVDKTNEEFTAFDETTILIRTVMEDDNGDSSSTWAWYPMEWSWTSVLILISAIVGIIGNTIVIIVVFNRRVMKNSTDILIGSLAVADLLSSITIIPVPSVKYVPSTWVGELYCRVVSGQVLVWFFVTASIFTLTAISVERYVAVIYPFTFRRIFSKRRTMLYILFIWSLCVINYSAFYFFFIKVNHATHTCMVPREPPTYRLFGGLSQVIFKFICPLFIMVITQGLIILTLHRQAKRFKYMSDTKAQTNQAMRSHDAKGRVIKMLLMVVFTFMVCWSPSQTSFLLYSARIIGPSYLYSPLNRIFTVLGFYNSCANPIIYTISNPEFRFAVKKVFTRNGTSSISAFGIKPETDNSETVMTNAETS